MVEHLGSLAEFAREDEEFLELLAREHCELLVRRTKVETRISVEDLLKPMGKGDFNTEGTENAEKRDETVGPDQADAASSN